MVVFTSFIGSWASFEMSNIVCSAEDAVAQARALGKPVRVHAYDLRTRNES